MRGAVLRLVVCIGADGSLGGGIGALYMGSVMLARGLFCGNLTEVTTHPILLSGADFIVLAFGSVSGIDLRIGVDVMSLYILVRRHRATVSR